MEARFHDEALECSPVPFIQYLPIPTVKPADDDEYEIPLSPDSRKYQVKMSLLQEKFDEVQNSNEKLRNRLMQMQKQITEEEKLKQLLVYTLESMGDKYYEGSLEFPPPIELPTPSPSFEDLEREKKRKERRERDRIREKARKQAKREAEKKAKMEALLASQQNNTSLITSSQ